MASNVTRDHHNLRRNLKLNGNYLSNDGGDEGISIADDGAATITSNTTAGNSLAVISSSLATGGHSLLLDINDSLTTSATKTLSLVDYDKSGVTASGQLSSTTGLGITMNDAATNHASGNVVMTGASITIDSANAQGNIFKTGMSINVAVDSVGDAANTNGLSMTVMDGATDILLKSSADTGDYCSIATTANGATTIATLDNGGEEADLTLNIDGYVDINSASGEDITLDSGDDIILDAVGGDVTILQADLTIPVDKKVIFGNTGEYIVGDDTNLTIVSSGHVEFDNCAVGFDRLEAAFNSSNTAVDFRLSNKYRLEVEGDITNVNLTFPAVSGNFLLVCYIAAGGLGDHDVSNWKVYESDDSAATTTDVMWAGGSVPAFTTGEAVDIVSFYWDADEQQAYGVASLAFATP